MLASFRYDPSTSEEFNGAGLFYFAEFQALANRALEHWFRTPQITGRDIFFAGNIHQGEAVSVELMDISASAVTSHIRIRRPDGKIIGRIFTQHGAPLDFNANSER